MTGLAAIAVMLAAAAAVAGAPGSSKAIRLDPGEFRWWPLHIRKAPSEIDCRFEVLQGGATVHAELLRQYDFRQFVRRRPYEKLTETARAARGSFSQTVPDRGDYAVVIMNSATAPTAIVSMYIQSKVNPDGEGAAQMLAPGRRLVVILISFAIFFVSAGWSGHRLIRAMKNAAS